jgi:DNA-binding GntR family transcriptional regulator
MAAQARFETKTEYVYHRLRDQIAEGRFKAGEHLRLGVVAEELQTSEMPVREALRMLQRDGLVEMHSHRGAVIAEIDWETLQQTVAVRMHLEVLAVEEATPCHDARSLARVDALLARMDDHVAQGSGRRFSATNREFHAALYVPTPNPVLVATIDTLWDRLWQVRSRSLFDVLPDQMAVAQEEHHGIAKAVRAGDGAGAASAMLVHRTSTLAAWRRAAEAESGAVTAP